MFGGLENAFGSVDDEAGAEETIVIVEMEDDEVAEDVEDADVTDTHESLVTPNTPNAWVSDLGSLIELHPELKSRQAVTSKTYVSTCGYLNGNASLSRTANSVFECRVDTKNAIWGFCPTIVLAISDCGLVGGCVDAHACNSECGISGDPTVTTLMWFVNPLTSARATLPSPFFSGFS